MHCLAEAPGIDQAHWPSPELWIAVNQTLQASHRRSIRGREPRRRSRMTTISKSLEHIPKETRFSCQYE
jgi:hypothetical protein